eukprot:4343725-Amphidinium_carterae.1
MRVEQAVMYSGGERGLALMIQFWSLGSGFHECGEARSASWQQAFSYLEMASCKWRIIPDGRGAIGLCAAVVTRKRQLESA